MPDVVRMTGDTMVGRDEELRSTLIALRRLREGRPGVVTVSGPAGIGKTRFATALGDALVAEGVRVMAGACLDLTAGAAPYSALVSAFRSVDPPAVQVLDALTGAVGMRRSRLFELLRSTLVALARRRTTVLVVEDVHWLDRVTRDALLYLTATARDGRWALVLTYRDDEVTSRPPARELLESLRRDPLVYVTLDSLSRDDVASHVASITGTRPSQEDTARIHGRTGGIPLLVEEVLAAEAAGTSGVPDHLRDLFLARVDRLGPAPARCVEVVAAVGVRCTERLVAAVLDQDRPTVAAALDRAVAAAVLAIDGKGYRLRHEMLREAVYAALSPARRRELHAGIASALATEPDQDVTALAHHWYAADEPAEAAATNLEAAALADRLHAPGEVHTFLERVLEHFGALPPEQAADLGGRGSVLARAAEAAYLSGDFARAVELAERGLEVAEEPWVAALRWERLARYCWVNGDGPGAQRTHERSVAVLSEDAPAHARARVLSGYAWHLAMASRPAEALVWSRQGLEAAEASGDPLERCRALLAWGYARGDQETGLAALRQGRDLAVAADAGEELARAHAGLDLSLNRLGRSAEREQVLRDGLEYVVAHGLARSYAPAMKYLLAEVLLDLGRWDEADDLLEGLAAEGVKGVSAMFTHAYRARLAAARGRAASVSSNTDRVESLTRLMPQQPIPLAIALSARAECFLWSGEPEKAVGHAARAETVSMDALVRAEATTLRLRAVADLAVGARLRGGQVPEVATVDERDAVIAVDARPHVLAAAAAGLAELSRRDGMRDPALWGEVVTAWEGVGNPYHAAYGRWRQAHALLRTRSGRGEAARLLAEAQRCCARLGARPLREAVELLAGSARIPLPGGGQEHRLTGADLAATELGLTPREMELLPLLVSGRTNTEIAESLVISPRTVGVHVSRILQKLGASRRTEAADIARRRGLVSS